MKTLTTIFVIANAVFGYSQNYIPTQRKVISKPTNQSLYHLEYELKHYAFANGDSTLLDNIRFEMLPAQREQSVDVEVFDPIINQTIILYSYDKMESKYMEKRGH